MSESVNAFTVYSSLELQINEFVNQLNKASQLLDSTLQNMSGAVSTLNIEPVEVHTEIVSPDISAFEIPAEILAPDRPEMPVATPFTVPSEIENPDLPVFPEEQTYILHTETEPLDPVTVPAPDDRNFIQKIKDSFSNLKNAVKSVPTDIAGKFKEMGTNIANNLKSLPSNVATKFSEMKTLATGKIKELPAKVAEVITSIPSKIGAVLKTIGTNISEAFKSGVESAKNALKELPEKASEALKNTGEKLKSIAETVAKAGTVAVSAVSAGVVAFGKSAVETGANFDKSMSQVAATMGKTNEEIADLRDFAQEMGRTTEFSATQSADALNYMALAGYDAETSMKMLPNVLNLASAGGMELALASDMITDSQSALGLSLDETTQLVDKMAKASSKSNTSVSQLGDAILTVGGTAKKLKGGTTELATVLGILADNGIKGSEGGTALRNIMNSLISPTEDAIAMLESMGTSLYDSEGNMRSLNDVFIDLRNGMSGLATQAEKDQVLTTIFNARDLKSAEALIANVGDRFNELSTEIDASAGAANAMAKTQLDNLAGQVTLFQSALEGAKIAVSDQLTPVLKNFVKMGTDGLSAVTDAFSTGVKESGLEKGFDNAVTALQPYIDKLINKVLSAIPEVVSIATKLISVLGQAIVKNIPKITKSVVPKIAQSAVLIVRQFTENIAKNAPLAIKSFSQMLVKIKGWFISNSKNLISAGMELVKSVSQGISENLPDMMKSVKEIMTFIMESISKNLPVLLDSGLKIIGSIGEGIVTNLPLLIDSALEIVRTLAEYLSENLPEMIPAIIDVVLQIVETLTEPKTLSDLIEAGLAIIIGLADGIIDSLPVLLERLPVIVQNIVDVIVNNLPKIIEVAVQIIDVLCTELLNGKNITKLIQSAVDVLNVLIDAIVDNIDDILLAVERIITTLCDELLSTESLKKIIRTGAELLGKLISGLCQIAGKLVGFAGMMFSEISSTLKAINWGEIGIAIVEGICSGMMDCDFVLKDYLNDFGDNWLTGIQAIFDINSPSRVMRDQVGKYLALGIGEGFAENADTAGRQISDAVSDWTSILQGKENELSETLKDVAENIRNTFNKPISINTEITTDSNLNRLKFPDISTVSENIYTVRSENVPDYRTETESPVIVENLNITLDSGFRISSDYDTEKFINKIAERLQARQIRITRGTGGVIF